MINAHAIEAFYEHRNRRIEAPVVERPRLAARLKDVLSIPNIHAALRDHQSVPEVSI
jgi:hypothetical protein